MLGIASVFLKGNIQIHLHCIFKPHACHNKPVSSEELMALFSPEAKCFHYKEGLMTAPLPGWERHTPSKGGHHTRSTLIGRIICCLFQLALQPLHTQSKHSSWESWQKPQRITKWWILLGQEIARVNYEPLFRHIGEEDITILNTQTYYEACQIPASGFNAARRPRHSFRNWHWWNFMNKQNIPLARGLWTPISQSSNKSMGWSSLHGHFSPCPNNMDREKWICSHWKTQECW